MKKHTEINSLCEKVIATLMETTKNPLANDHFTMNKWEWPQGVAAYGVYNYYLNTGKKEYLKFMIDWYNHMIKTGLPDKNVNTMAPMLTLTYIYEVTQNDEYLKICKEWAEWVMKKMPRTKEDGLQHITSDSINEQQIWDDTLFMTVLFLARMGKITNNNKYINEAIKQFLLHIKYLYDTKTGLWYHGWTFKERNNFAGAFWARGNCWFTAGVVELIEILGINDAVKEYLIQTLEAQVDKLVELQNENGMWHTLLDDPSSYVETSATAGFAYGILKAVRKNYISKSYMNCGLKAAKAVISRIDKDGTVLEVSYGTAMGMTKEHYKNIEICPTAYGQALAILLMTEVVKIDF